MLVSILLPVFNGADSLGAAIGSILAQTLEDFELIVVNDGSTDTTLKVAKSFADPRIRIINIETNGGLINALNTGLAEARGQFLARMDHDDISHPERLLRQVNAMLITRAVICGSAIQPFGAIGGKAIVYPQGDAEIRAALPIVSPFAHPAVMMRTDVCRNLGYLASALHCEDYDLWWRMAGEGSMMNLPDSLLQYRIHASQISAIQRPTQLGGMAAAAVENLRKTGRFRSAYDLDCHRRALSYEPVDTLEELAAIGEWLRWLRESFGVDGDAVANHYLRVWRGVCSRQRHLGVNIWSIYRCFKPVGRSLKADLLVFLAAYGGLGPEDPKFKTLRGVLRR